MVGAQSRGIYFFLDSQSGTRTVYTVTWIRVGITGFLALRRGSSFGRLLCSSRPWPSCPNVHDAKATPLVVPPPSATLPPSSPLEKVDVEQTYQNKSATFSTERKRRRTRHRWESKRSTRFFIFSARSCAASYFQLCSCLPMRVTALFGRVPVCLSTRHFFMFCYFFFFVLLRFD